MPGETPARTPKRTEPSCLNSLNGGNPRNGRRLLRKNTLTQNAPSFRAALTVGQNLVRGEGSFARTEVQGDDFS